MKKLNSNMALCLNDYPDLMTVSEMQSALCISRSLSYKLIREGTVPSIRVGSIIRIPASDVSRLSRATQGVKIMRVGEDANIIAMARVIKEESEEDGGSAAAEAEQSAEAAEPEADNQISIELE